MNKNRAAAYRLSFLVALALAALTIIEYYVGTHFPSAVFLMLLAVVKAVLVLRFFMHVNRLWAPEGEH